MDKSANALICTELHSVSDNVQVTAENQQQQSTEGKLALFEYRPLPDATGGIAFVGGSVSAIDFHPIAKGICAISAHSHFQPTHELLTCYHGAAHIQLWSFSPNSAKCFALIPHQGNCVWDLKWKPLKQAHFDHDSNVQGTLAAALGDGTVQVYDIDTLANPSDTPIVLSPTTVTLRNYGQLLERVPVHVVQWSTDGELLVVGSADGSIEIYQTSSPDKTWPKWSMPGHESVIMDLRWLSATHLCSLGLSCVLRLRDIRDPVSMLEQNAEGLSGSLSMEALEPNVTVVGGDHGYLRVVRMSGADGVISKLPMKRVHLQTGAFRDMKSLTVGKSRTLFYTGGPEGILHECLFPRPIWASPDMCNIGRTRIKQKLQWTSRTEGEGETLHLQLGEAEETEIKGESRASGTKGKKITRKSRAVGKVSEGKEYTMFGEGYRQKSVINRIAVSSESGLLAVGIDGGVVTVLGLKLEEMDVQEEPKKIIKPLRKRGRPRTVSFTEGQPSSADTVPSMETREEEKEGKKKRKAAVVFGPKRKRGRPRKTEESKTQKAEKHVQKQVGGKKVQGEVQDNGQGEEVEIEMVKEQIVTEVKVAEDAGEVEVEAEGEIVQREERVTTGGREEVKDSSRVEREVKRDKEKAGTERRKGKGIESKAASAAAAAAAAAATTDKEEYVEDREAKADKVSTQAVQDVEKPTEKKSCLLRLRIRGPLGKRTQRSRRLQRRIEGPEEGEKVYVRLRVREAREKLYMRLPLREISGEQEEEEEGEEEEGEEGRRTRRVRKPSWKMMER